MAEDDIRKGLRRLRPSSEVGLANPTGESDMPIGGPSMRGVLAEAIASPAIKKGGTKAMAEKIFQHAEGERTPKYPPAKEPVFGPADPALTKQLVPQTSIRDKLPPVDTSRQLPVNDRSRPILEATPDISRLLAKDLSASEAKPLAFYSTGSVLQGLMDRAGMSPEAAQGFMRDWAGQGAATSPRTKTPSNLRNASYLMYRRGEGDPLSSEKQWREEGNRPGFPMIGRQHIPLSEAFATEKVDPWANPKPYTFRENWSGNMSDVTGDTHNFRAVLDAFDRLHPGQLPREWFKNTKGFNTYKESGGFKPTGQLPNTIDDTLKGAVVPGTGKKAQTEYPVMTGPTYGAAEHLGIAPAEAQERLWFEKGKRTGLKSPPMTIPDLLNSQIEATARVLGIHPEKILRLWSQHKIPLAEAGPMNVPGQTAVG